MSHRLGGDFEMRMVFEADMSATYTRVRPGGRDLVEGTWRLEGANTVFMDGTFNGDPSSIFVQVLPGVAFGYPLYERLP